MKPLLILLLLASCNRTYVEPDFTIDDLIGTWNYSEATWDFMEDGVVITTPQMIAYYPDVIIRGNRFYICNRKVHKYDFEVLKHSEKEIITNKGIFLRWQD